MKIFLTGGSGLLGTELQKYIKADAPSHKELDITRSFKLKKKYDLVIHCAAYTDVVRAEKERVECVKANLIGTLNVIKATQGTPFVHISTEYIYNPVNFYSWMKLEAEKIVNAFANPYLIIRTLFKPNPFPHKRAFKDQYTRGDYVDVIAPLIVSEILRWDKKISGARDVGTGRKTMLELAKRTRPDVKPCSVDDVKNVKLPKDYE